MVRMDHWPTGPWCQKVRIALAERDPLETHLWEPAGVRETRAGLDVLQGLRPLPEASPRGLHVASR